MLETRTGHIPTHPTYQWKTIHLHLPEKVRDEALEHLDQAAPAVRPALLGSLQHPCVAQQELQQAWVDS